MREGIALREPAWLDAAGTAGSFASFSLPARPLRAAVEARVWSPGEGELPMLVVHDGPEYDAKAAMTRYAGAMIASGALPPFRVALLRPGDRDEWYSASAAYSRALCGHVLPRLRAAVPTTGRPVGMGASLGALALLHAERRWPGTFAGLFLQSGSFFVPRFDAHESVFGRYARIVRFVRSVRRAGRPADALPVVLTCGVEEENVHNNRVMAEALAAPLQELPGQHDWTAWRDAFDPHLTGLLTRLWAR